jgi:hypothetical protein
MHLSIRSNFNSDALGRLILPQGLRFCTEREIDQCVNKAHPFVMTKEDGEKSYGVSLIFYERVEDSNICHAVHTLEVGRGLISMQAQTYT